MPIHHDMVLAAKKARGASTQRSPIPKFGDLIFAGTDYPKSYDDFIGQRDAVLQLRTAVLSAKTRNAALGHILLASGAHGIGKTTLAQIIAYDMGTGLVEASGAMTGDDFLKVIGNLDDGDILFWDEFHLAVAGNRNRADFLLPFMLDCKVPTKRGYIDVPRITLIAATTEVGKLPQTVISRFPIKPHLEYYTDEEAVLIARKLAVRVGVRITNEAIFKTIAAAANGNPRDMRSILEQVRDIAVAEEGKVDLGKALRWAGLTRDGLNRDQQAYLIALLGSPDYTCGENTLKAVLGEPGTMRHIENPLIQRSLVTMSGRGRMLTETGIERAKQLAESA